MTHFYDDWSQDAEADQRSGDDHRRRVGVRHPAEHDRKATLRSGSQIKIRRKLTFMVTSKKKNGEVCLLR
jgi:hypothetical protein